MTYIKPGCHLAAASRNLIRMAFAAVLLTGLSVLSLSARASAVLVNDGVYTYDPSTHLDWLDVTQTLNLSYNDVLNNVGTSYVAEGWHYATANDLVTFYTDAGLPMGGQRDMFRTSQDADFNNVAIAMLNLYNLIGIADSGVTAVDQWYQTEGFFGPLDVSGKPGQGGLALDLRTDDIDSGLSAIIDAGILDADTRSTGFGSWLIRNDPNVAVTPLPGALVLFASALTLMTVVARRRRR